MLKQITKDHTKNEWYEITLKNYNIYTPSDKCTNISETIPLSSFK